MGLPEPAFSFTIPSIHDDTTLDCRIYIPRASSTRPLDRLRQNGAIIAHPYAPLGGCYDDYVVHMLALEFLKECYVVGTFNFRGAPGSLGRTSWTGKAELDDYVSFAGFFMNYMHLLNDEVSSPASITTSLPSNSASEHTDQPPQSVSHNIVFGGYSYGSLMVTNLPIVEDILAKFSTVEQGTAAAEIVIRARDLAKLTEQNGQELDDDHDDDDDHSPNNQTKQSHNQTLSITMGGEETSPISRRGSKEARRSGEGVRNFDFPRKLRSLSFRKKTHHNNQPGDPTASSIPIPSVKYLLISPLQPPISTALAPSFGISLFGKRSPDSHIQTLTQHPTLAVYGDSDMFTSANKLRSWGHKMAQLSKSRFHFVEIAGAGHFWREDGAETKLIIALHEWLRNFSVA